MLRSPPDAPEARAREHIDRDLVEAGWVVQNRDEMNRGGEVQAQKYAEGSPRRPRGATE